MEYHAPEHPTAKKILDLAYYAFNEQGYRRVSMDLVASRLRISKKTIYVHFASKEDILETALNQMFSEIEKKIQQIVELPTGREVLFGYFATYKFYLRNLSPSLKREILTQMPHLQGRIESFESQVLHRNLNLYLKSIRKSGQIDYPSPTREFVLTLIHMMDGMVEAPEDKARFVLVTLLKGLAMKKKKKK